MVQTNCSVTASLFSLEIVTVVPRTFWETFENGIYIENKWILINHLLC